MLYPVRVFEVQRPPNPSPTSTATTPLMALTPPKEVKGFNVNADDTDAAKREVKKLFKAQGKEVRSLSVLADGGGLLVYVFAGGR